MTLKPKYILAAALLAPLFVLAPAHAQRRPAPEANQNASSSGQTTEARTISAQAEDISAEDLETALKQRREELAATRQERLEQRKAARQLRLTVAQEARLKARCVQAQGVIKSLDEKVHVQINRRHRAYENISQQVGNLLTRLEGSDVDTTELADLVVELDEKIAQYKEHVAEYQAALIDLHAMGCAEDVTAFQVSLVSARELRESLKAEIQDIRSHVMDVIKPALVELRQQLAGEAGDATDEESIEETQNTTEETVEEGEE